MVLPTSDMYGFWLLTEKSGLIRMGVVGGESSLYSSSHRAWLLLCAISAQSGCVIHLISKYFNFLSRSSATATSKAGRRSAKE